MVFGSTEFLSKEKPSNTLSQLVIHCVGRPSTEHAYVACVHFSASATMNSRRHQRYKWCIKLNAVAASLFLDCYLVRATKYENRQCINSTVCCACSARGNMNLSLVHFSCCCSFICRGRCCCLLRAKKINNMATQPLRMKR